MFLNSAENLFSVNELKAPESRMVSSIFVRLLEVNNVNFCSIFSFGANSQKRIFAITQYRANKQKVASRMHQSLATRSGLKIQFVLKIRYCFALQCLSERYILRILLERPRLVSDHFNLATSITLPNKNEAEDSGYLNYMLYFQDNLYETIQMSNNNIGFIEGNVKV